MLQSNFTLKALEGMVWEHPTIALYLPTIESGRLEILTLKLELLEEK